MNAPKKNDDFNFIVLLFSIFSFLAFLFQLYKSAPVSVVYLLLSFIFICLRQIKIAGRDEIVLEVCKKVLEAVLTASILAFIAFMFKGPFGDYVVEKKAEGEALGTVYKMQLEGKHDEVIRATDSTIISSYPEPLKVQLNELRKISEDVATVSTITTQK